VAGLADADAAPLVADAAAALPLTAEATAAPIGTIATRAISPNMLLDDDPDDEPDDDPDDVPDDVPDDDDEQVVPAPEYI